MNKLGKKGKLNIKANKKIKRLFEERGIMSCEARLDGCTGDYGLTFAHKHKRIYYSHSDAIDLLYDFNEVGLFCLNCHIKAEQSKLLTLEIFNRIRVNRDMQIIVAADEILDGK